MSNPCGGLTLSPYGGDICQHGYVKGLLMSEDKLSAITETNAALLATWTALILADQSARLYPIMFDISEPAENEIVEEEMSDGGSVILSTKEGTNKYDLVSSNTALQTIYAEFRDGKEMYVYQVTSKGFIRGKEVTANTIEQVKVRVYAQYIQATPTTSAKVSMYIQNMEDWVRFQNAVDPTDVFDPTALEGVQNMTFTAGTPTTTTCTLDVKNLDKVGITSLTTGASSYFRLYNNTTDAAHATPITPSGVTVSGSVYTLTYATQSSSDVLEFTYLEPSTSSEYYDLKANVTGTVA